MPRPLTNLLRATPQEIADDINDIGAALAAQPNIRNAAAAAPGLFAQVVRLAQRRIRSPGTPPATQLTESPRRYSDRKTAGGPSNYFDQYNKNRPSVPVGATMTGRVALSRSWTLGSTPLTPPKVAITQAGARVARVPVRFVVVSGISTVQDPTGYTNVLGELDAGLWDLQSLGVHVLQAVAGPLHLTFEVTVS